MPFALADGIINKNMHIKKLPRISPKIIKIKMISITLSISETYHSEVANYLQYSYTYSHAYSKTFFSGFM